jgi:hypothetical protein
MDKSARTSSDIWIGMVEVRPTPGCELLGEARGAFVNVLAWAVDLDEYCAQSNELIAYFGLETVGIEKNAEPLANRGAEETLDKDIARIAAEVRRNPRAIMYSTFHTWEKTPPEGLRNERMRDPVEDGDPKP